MNPMSAFFAVALATVFICMNPMSAFFAVALATVFICGKENSFNGAGASAPL